MKPRTGVELQQQNVNLIEAVKVTDQKIEKLTALFQQFLEDKKEEKNEKKRTLTMFKNNG